MEHKILYREKGREHSEWKGDLKEKYTFEGGNNLEKHWRRISREKRKCSEENSQQKYYAGKSR